MPSAGDTERTGERQRDVETTAPTERYAQQYAGVHSVQKERKRRKKREEKKEETNERKNGKNEGKKGKKEREKQETERDKERRAYTAYWGSGLEGFELIIQLLVKLHDRRDIATSASRERPKEKAQENGLEKKDEEAKEAREQREDETGTLRKASLSPLHSSVPAGGREGGWNVKEPCLQMSAPQRHEHLTCTRTDICRPI